jgi:SAM-dependent methyltransferase
LRDALQPEGQLWIATHSPVLTAEFADGSIYYAEDNNLREAGTHLDSVMDGLLGGSAARVKLVELLADAERLNFYRFAAECLLSPGIAPARQGDRQGEQLREVLSGLDSRPRWRILDYGAGRARMAAALAEAGDADSPLAGIDYHAWNRSECAAHRDECERNLRSLYPSEGERARERLHTQLSDFYGEGQVDVVLLCNVLHEVPPHEWSSLFRNCCDVLKEDGFVLIMEDQYPSHGELPHKGGFLVMDLDELRMLFGTNDVASVHESADGRLTAFRVARKHLCSVGANTLKRTVEKVLERALRGLNAVRQDQFEPPLSASHRGRRHAFFVLLAANAANTLSSLGGAGPLVAPLEAIDAAT